MIAFKIRSNRPSAGRHIGQRCVGQRYAGQQYVSQRSGAMFAYFMVYLMLAGATAATAGMLLHQMFKARTADVDRSNGIRQLLRTDKQLRVDWGEAIQHSLEQNLLTLVTADQLSIAYSIDGDRLQRIVRSEDEAIQASDRFQFPKRSLLQFVNSEGEGTPGIVFRLTSHRPGQATKAVPSKQDLSILDGRSVEIFLAIPATAQNATPADEASDTVSNKTASDVPSDGEPTVKDPR